MSQQGHAAAFAIPVVVLSGTTEMELRSYI